MSDADWSKIPTTLYVVAARQVDPVVWDVTMCNVPMVMAPEVSFIRADLYDNAIETLASALNQSAEWFQGRDNVERLRWGRCDPGPTSDPRECGLPENECPCAINADAANEITRLRLELAGARRALGKVRAMR